MGAGTITANVRCRTRYGYAGGVEGLTIAYLDVDGKRQLAQTPRDEVTSYAVGRMIDVNYWHAKPSYVLTRADLRHNPAVQFN